MSLVYHILTAWQSDMSFRLFFLLSGASDCCSLVFLAMHVNLRSGIRYQVFLFNLHGEPLARGYYKWHPEKKKKGTKGQRQNTKETQRKYKNFTKIEMQQKK